MEGYLNVKFVLAHGIDTNKEDIDECNEKWADNKLIKHPTETIEFKL